jgi:hypothetical protein
MPMVGTGLSLNVPGGADADPRTARPMASRVANVTPFVWIGVPPAVLLASSSRPQR